MTLLTKRKSTALKNGLLGSYIWWIIMPLWGFPNDSSGKESTYNAGDTGSIPGSGKSPGWGNGNPLQSSCLENSMCRGAWLDTVHGVAKSRTRLIESHTHKWIQYLRNTRPGQLPCWAWSVQVLKEQDRRQRYLRNTQLPVIPWESSRDKTWITNA